MRMWMCVPLACATVYDAHSPPPATRIVITRKMRTAHSVEYCDDVKPSRATADSVAAQRTRRDIRQDAAHTHARARAHTSARAHKHKSQTQIQTHTHAHTRTHTHTHARTHAHMYQHNSRDAQRPSVHWRHSPTVVPPSAICQPSAMNATISPPTPRNAMEKLREPARSVIPTTAAARVRRQAARLCRWATECRASVVVSTDRA
jgi:hypothetical protein